MAKSSFYSGRGVTPENPDVTPVEPNNINAIEDSKNAAALSEAAAEVSKDAAAQSASDEQDTAYDANASKILAEQAANFAGAFTSVNQIHADNAAASATAAAASETAAAASETAAAASETAAAGSLSGVNQAANLASTKAGEASTSAANAAASEAAAATSASNAASSVASIGNSEANAAASASAAAASEAAASTSASNSATSASNAASSANSASASQVAAAASEVASAASEVASAASEAAAATSESNASTSESNAASSATSASTSAATATTQASNAATSAGQSASSATNSATSAANAAASEAAAAASESASATSETNAANSASAAATSATQSAASAASIGNAETNSAASATQAAASAANAASSESNAATSESNAATSAADAATSASNASTSASDAATSASTAQGSAQTATSQASSAAAQAANAASSATSATASQAAASASAGAASSSASAAAASASTAQSARDSALAALDSFDDRYLGQKASDPSTDNDGDALVGGALYYNTTDDVMKVYEGSTWVAAYASLSGTLTAASNLGDLDNAADARQNLGVEIGVDVQAFDSVLAGTTASYTTAQSAKLAGIENGAKADQTITAGAGLDGGGTGDVTLSHSNTSSVANTSNASNTFIQNLSFDTYGHVTSVSNGAMSIGSGTLSISGSGKIQGGGTFGANQTGNTTITLTHAAGTASSVNNSGGTVIQDITLDSTGHIASIGSYNLDGRYYTETEADSRFANVTGDTFTGDVTIDSASAWNAGSGMLNVGGTGDGRLQVRHIWGKASTSAGTDNLWLQYSNPSKHVQIGASGGGNNLYVAGELYAQGYFGGQRVFHDAYHPNADKWTTARTLSLSGDASGSVSWDGSANASLSVTVANDSHTHDGRYYTESEADSRFVNVTGDSMTGELNVTHNGGATGSSAPSYGQANIELQTSSNYTPAISFHRGSYSAGVLYEYDGQIYSKAWVSRGQDGLLLSTGNIGSYAWTSSNDGSGSGLDADKLDGYHLSGTRNAANTVPVRDGNGYLQLGWINTTSGATTSTINKIYASYDDYIRYITPATLISQLNLSTTSHNHTYNVNDSWLRDNGDNANVKLYGNSRQMAFRTDGTTEYSSGVGGYPFAWMYGGDASSNRIMLLNTSGDLWTNTNGWLSTALAGKLSTTAKAADSNLLDGIDSSSFLRSDASDSMSGNLTFTSSSNAFAEYNGSAASPYLRFKTNGTNNGYIQFTSSGYSYFWNDRVGQGISMTSGTSGLQWYTGGAYRTIWHSANDGSGSGLDADLLDGAHANTGAVVNTIAKRDTNGDIFQRYGFASYFNMSHSAGTRSSDTVFYSSNDNYIRKNNSTGFRNSLGLGTGSTPTFYGLNISGTVAATSYTGDGSQLTGIAAGAVGGVFYENDQTVTSNYTITNGKNAMSAGPITINNGVTVTVGAGETWTVV